MIWRPGITSFIFARHGVLGHLDCYGFADLERKAPAIPVTLEGPAEWWAVQVEMRPDSIVRLYSMTKCVVSVALGVCLEAKRLLKHVDHWNQMNASKARSWETRWNNKPHKSIHQWLRLLRGCKTDSCCMCYTTLISQKDGSSFSVWITSYNHTISYPKFAHQCPRGEMRVPNSPQHCVRKVCLTSMTMSPSELDSKQQTDGSWFNVLDSSWAHSDLGCFGCLDY